MALKQDIGAEEAASKAWCDAAAAGIIKEMSDFLDPPVNEVNKDDVLRQVQNWIIRERKTIKTNKEKIN